MQENARFKIVEFFSWWEIWFTAPCPDRSPVVAHGPWGNGPDEYYAKLRKDLRDAVKSARSTDQLYEMLKDHCFEQVKY